MAASERVGSLHVEILPDVSRFARNLSRDMNRFGQEASRNFYEGFSRGNPQFESFFQNFQRQSFRHGHESGRQFSDGMARGIERGGAPWAIRTLTAAIIGIGPAAIPAFAALTGAAAAAGTAIVAASGGLAVFGAAAKSQLTPVTEAYKELRQAQEAYRKATTDAGKKTALEKQKIALAELNPLQRSAVMGMVGLSEAWKSFGSTAQRPILGAFTSGMRGLINLMETFKPVVLPVANVVRGLADSFEQFAKGPGLRGFANWLQVQAPVAITGFVVAAKDFGSGLANIGRQIGLVSDNGQGFIVWLQQVADRFKSWTESGSQEQITQFAQAARQSLPAVGEALKQIANAITQLIIAAGPIGGVVLVALSKVAEAIAYVAEEFPWLIQALWAAAVASKAYAVAKGIATAAVRLFSINIRGATLGMRLYAIGARIATLTTRAFAITLALVTSPIGLIIIGITALVAALVWAWKKFPAFRNVVFTVMDAVKNAFVSAWNFIKPVFTAIGDWLGKILPVVFKIFATVAKVYWAIISTQIKIAWFVIRTVFALLRAYVTKILAPTFVWLYKSVVKPIWNLIVKAIQFAWGYIKFVFNVIKWTLTNVVGPAFRWLYTKVIKPVWNSISSHISMVWNKFIKPLFNILMSSLRRDIPAAFNAAKSAIAKIWDGIRKIASGPIKFFLDVVWNKGLGGLWGKAAKIVPGLPAFPKADVSGFARGGVLPGYSRWQHGDDQLVPMRRGEGVYVSEAMKDPYERARLHAVNRAAMRGESLDKFRGGFARGGILDNVTSFLKRPADLAFASMKGLREKGADVMAKAAKMLVNSIGGSGGFPTLARGMANAMIDKIAGFIAGKLPSLGQGQAGDVVRTAIDHFKRGADGDYNNRYQRAFGMPGQPWCAMFISEVFKAAGAGGSIPRSAAVASFADLPTRKGEPQPGDLGLYGNIRAGGASSHINLYIGNNETIGGNESDAIRRTKGRIGSATKVAVPNYADGGSGFKGAVDGVVPGNARSGLITQAMRAAGVPPPGSMSQWVNGMNTLVQRESGWRIATVNTWDSNAKAGNPSKGLAQTIPSTFKAFHAPGTSWNIYDPIANLAAAIRYIKSRYGNITNVQQANPNMPPRGYAKGGMVDIANQDIGWSKISPIQDAWRVVGGERSQVRSVKGYANGGRTASGELAMVGEEGPELVRFDGPAQVYPHAQSMKMLMGMAGINGYAKGGKVKPKKKPVPKAPFTDSVFQTLAYQLSGSTSQINLAGNKLINAIRDKFSGKKENSLVGMITHGVKRLNAMAAQMATAKKTLADATRFQQKTVENIKGMFSPEQLVGMPPSDMIAFLKEQAADAAGMSKNIAALKSKGYSASILATMLEMDDPRDVADFAADLSSATANQVKQINSLVSQGSNIANSIGNQAFLAYTGGKSAAQLTKMSKTPQKAMNNYAHSLAVKLGKQLGVKKPPKKKTFDNGGYLEDIAFNKSGKPEPVFSQSQWSRIDRLVRYVDTQEQTNAGNGDNITIVTNFTDADDVARAVMSRRRRSRATNSLPPVRSNTRR